MRAERYDLVIGNPPYLKMSTKDPLLKQYQTVVSNEQANNLAAFFVERAMRLADYDAQTPQELTHTKRDADTKPSK